MTKEYFGFWDGGRTQQFGEFINKDKIEPPKNMYGDVWFWYMVIWLGTCIYRVNWKQIKNTGEWLMMGLEVNKGFRTWLSPFYWFRRQPTIHPTHVQIVRWKDKEHTYKTSSVPLWQIDSLSSTDDNGMVPTPSPTLQIQMCMQTIWTLRRKLELLEHRMKPIQTSTDPTEKEECVRDFVIL